MATEGGPIEYVSADEDMEQLALGGDAG